MLFKKPCNSVFKYFSAYVRFTYLGISFYKMNIFSLDKKKA